MSSDSVDGRNLQMRTGLIQRAKEARAANANYVTGPASLEQSRILDECDEAHRGDLYQMGLLAQLARIKAIHSRNNCYIATEEVAAFAVRARASNVQITRRITMYGTSQFCCIFGAVPLDGRLISLGERDCINVFVDESRPFPHENIIMVMDVRLAKAKP